MTCDGTPQHYVPFENDDTVLLRRVGEVLDERRAAGIDGLVGDLTCIIINAEPDRHRAAAEQLIRYTGYALADAFENEAYRTCVLRRAGSADILVRARLTGANPFADLSLGPRSAHLPNTRLETFVFESPDVERYAAIQANRGIALTRDRGLHFICAQTPPSRLTGAAVAVIQWTGTRGDYRTSDSQSFPWDLAEPEGAHRRHIGLLDHAAVRLHAEDRDAAILEFMQLTNYAFDMAIHVKDLNSITNVTRLRGAKFALVFTSGIRPYIDDAVSGPTEKFVHNYGVRTHHLAFHTENIERTYAVIREDGLEFLTPLFGSPEEGLKQAFSAPLEHSLLVNEYICRYGDFDGFFTQSNVTLLTEATDRQ